MGLSLASAIIGLGMVGTALLIIRRQRKFAIILLITGIALIFIPYGYIYFFLD